MKKLLFSILHFFLFSNIYIACVAVLGIYFTVRYLNIDISIILYAFVFFSTLVSYSFHWYLTNDKKESIRHHWNTTHKKVHIILFITSLAGAIITVYFLKSLLGLLFILGVLTFIYSAPKIPIKPFVYLRKWVIGKTFYLALIWSFVLVLLPIINSKTEIHYLYFLLQFIYIYIICVLFDYRDKEENEFKSFIIQLSRKEVVHYIYFLFILLLGGLYLLVYRDLKEIYTLNHIVLFVCFSLLFTITNISTKIKHDYWYYLILDGLIGLPGLIILFV